MNNTFKTTKKSQRPVTYYSNEYKFISLNGIDNFAFLFYEFLKNIKTIGFTIKEKQKPKILEDIYLDDSVFSLHRNNCLLRMRKMLSSCGNTLLTFKKRLSAGLEYEEGLYFRIEDEAIISNEQREKLLRGETINVLPIRLIQYVVPFCGKLRSLIKVKNNRKTTILENKQHRIVTVSFDEVVYLSKNKRFGTYNEIEIKSRGNSNKVIDPLIDFFLDKGCIPTAQSKYERGISLLKTSKATFKVKKPVIIDTDCGVDDALALITALKSPELDVKAITTVSGNVHIDKVIPNVFKVFQALDIKSPPLVSRGADRPLKKDFEDVPSVHGHDGLGDVIPTPNNIKIDDKPAWKVICELARQNPKEITLITLGPMTNLALAIKNDPDGVMNLKEIVAMGGVFFNTGNIRPDAEFNVYSDPDAAKIVVDFCISKCRKIPVDRHGKEITIPDNATKGFYEKNVAGYRERNPQEDETFVPLTFIGLDVTHKVVLRRKLIQALFKANPNNKVLNFVSLISKKYMDFYEQNEGLQGCYLHDPLAVAYVINPTFVDVKKHIIDVETRGQFTSGMIFPDDRPTKNPLWRNPANEVIGIATSVENVAFEEFFIKRVMY